MTTRLRAGSARDAVAASVLVGAAQLGVGHGLGFITWNQTYDPNGDSAWTSLLTWVCFIFTTSVLAGATIGRRTPPRLGGRGRADGRLVSVVFATLGAVLVLPLAWLPARAAHPPINADPALTVALAACAAIAVGTVFALIAAWSPPFAGGLAGTAGWVWCFALVSAGSRQNERGNTGQGLDSRVGLLDLSPLGYTGTWWSGTTLLILMSVVLGLVVAILARWGGSGWWATAPSGLAGPALVSSAYLLAGPGRVGDHATQTSAYRATLIAVGAGLCASLAVAVFDRARNPADPIGVAHPASSTRPAGSRQSAGGFGAVPPGEATARVPGPTTPGRARAARIDADTGVGLIPPVPRQAPKPGGPKPGGPPENDLPAEVSEYVDWVSELAADRKTAATTSGVHDRR